MSLNIASSRRGHNNPFSIEYILSDRCGADARRPLATSPLLPFESRALWPPETCQPQTGQSEAEAQSPFPLPLPLRPLPLRSSAVQLRTYPQQPQHNENMLATFGVNPQAAAPLPLCRGLSNNSNSDFRANAFPVAFGGLPPQADIKWPANADSCALVQRTREAAASRELFASADAAAADASAQAPLKRTRKSRDSAVRPTFVEMIGRALLGVDERPLLLSVASAPTSLPAASRSLTLPEIYTYLERHFGERLANERDWKGRVRNNLSINECFCRGAPAPAAAPALSATSGIAPRARMPPIASATAAYRSLSRWTVNPLVINEFSAGDFSRRLDRRRVKRLEFSDTTATKESKHSAS